MPGIKEEVQKAQGWARDKGRPSNGLVVVADPHFHFLGAKLGLHDGAGLFHLLIAQKAPGLVLHGGNGRW